MRGALRSERCAWTRLEALVQLRIAFGCPFTDEMWRGLTSLKALAVLICRYSTDTTNKALGASTVSLGAFGAGPTPHTNAGSWGEEASGRDAHGLMVKCPPYTEKLAEFVDRIAPAQIITAEAGMLLCAVRGPWPAC